jgi:hypothetical protein
MVSKELTEANRKKARDQREKSLKAYYENPNYCLHCGEIIEIGDHRQAADARKSKFCSKSCAAKHNNQGKDRWEKTRLSKKPTPTMERGKSGRLKHYTSESRGECGRCGKQVDYSQRPDGKAYTKRHFCVECLPIIKSQNGRERYGENALPKPIEEMTKGEIWELKKSSHKVKPIITKHARKVYSQSGRPMRCFICDYSVYVEICHKRDVADFPMDALIAEINDLDNLEALCPTHHKEFDKHLIEINEEARTRFQDAILAWAKKIQKERGTPQSSDTLIQETLDLLREIKAG